MSLSLVFSLLRVRQWIKNLFVFAPLIFARELFEVEAFRSTALVVLAFCLTASSVYILNDLQDRDADRAHPIKRFRPIPSGVVSPSAAMTLALLLLLAGLFLGMLEGTNVAAILMIYVVLNALYSWKLKHVVILDVMIIAIGFMLRILAGGQAIDVTISPWIVLCGSLLALFLALSKRRQELRMIAEPGNENATREVLDHYSIALLDQMILIILSATLLSYFLYTFSAETTNDDMMWTTVFVVYGIFRYLYLLHQPRTEEDPTSILLHDRSLLATITLWIGGVIYIFYR